MTTPLDRPVVERLGLDHPPIKTVIAIAPSRRMADISGWGGHDFWFGWWMYNMTEPQEPWIDEIAVDYKPIGCAR